MQAQMNHSTLVKQLEFLHARLSSLESNFSLGVRQERNPSGNRHSEHAGNPNSDYSSGGSRDAAANPVHAQRYAQSARPMQSERSMWRTESRSARSVHDVSRNIEVERLAAQIVEIMHSWGEGMDASELVHLPTHRQFSDLKSFIIQNRSDYPKAELKNAISRQHMNAYFRFMAHRVYQAVEQAYR